jgi:hypothetical protein
MVAASAAAVSSVVAFAVFAVVAIGGSGGTGGGGGSGSVAAFNACISQTRFLAVEEHRSGNKVIEMLKDRAHGAVVGQFAVLPSVRAAEALRTPFGIAGTGAVNGRYVLFTRTPLGRDASAIERCGEPEFPLVP